MAFSAGVSREAGTCPCWQSPTCGVKVGRLDCVSTATRPKDSQARSEAVDRQTDRPGRQTEGEPVALSPFCSPTSPHPIATEGTTKHSRNSIFDSGDGLYLPKRSCLQSFLSRLSCPPQTITLGHATIARYTIHFLSICSLSVSPTPSPSTLLSLSFSLSPCELSVTHYHPYRLVLFRIQPIGSETRRGQARGEARRHGTHGTGQTPTCGLRRRSSRHHHIPPNLGKATQLVCTTETAAGNLQSAVQAVARPPLRVRASAWTNSSSSWPTQPTRCPRNPGVQCSRQYLLYRGLSSFGVHTAQLQSSTSGYD